MGLNNYFNCLAMSIEQGNVQQDNNNLFLTVYEQMLFPDPSFLSEAHRAGFIFNSDILKFQEGNIIHILCRRVCVNQPRRG